jgi:hypothetical protein
MHVVAILEFLGQGLPYPEHSKSDASDLTIVSLLFNMHFDLPSQQQQPEFIK